MPLHADLYLDRIELARYADADTCQICRVDSFEQLLDRLRAGAICPGQCPHWPAERVTAFQLAIDAGQVLPPIPSLDMPRPAAAGWFELNGAAPESPALVTSNSQLTHEVLLAVLSTVSLPVWMVSVDTGGHTVDMSLVYQTLTAAAVVHALRTANACDAPFAGRVILPGLAAGLAAELTQRLGRPVEVGPTCAAELPLFLTA